MAYESMIIFEVSFPWLEGTSPMGPMSQDIKETTAALEPRKPVIYIAGEMCGHGHRLREARCLATEKITSPWVIR